MKLKHSQLTRGTGPVPVRFQRAFTLIELLAVIAIIAILASLAGPIISRLGVGDRLALGGRQMLDDLSFARSKAMATRSTVYVVFLPPGLETVNLALYTNSLDLVAITNTAAKTYTGYALFSRRSIGDQPGTVNPKYLTEWKELPQGVAIHPEQFMVTPTKTNYVSGRVVMPFSYQQFPFPNATSPTISLPYLAFNAMGQLEGGQDFRLQVCDARVGRIRDPDNQNQLLLAASTITPDAPPLVFLEWETNGMTFGVNYTNYYIYAHEVEINWLTGRGKFLQPEIQ